MDANEVTDVDFNEIDDRPSDISATWEHESLAKVRVKVFRGHQDTVTSGYFLDKDQKILSASHDGSVILWPFEGSAHLHEYTSANEGARVSMAKPSPDGTKFVCVGWDRKVHLWDIETCQILWSGVSDGILNCCNFSHDGNTVLTGSDLDSSVVMWDINTGEAIKVLSDLHTSTLTSCQFSGCDDRIVTTSMDMTTKFYDLKTDCNTITLRGHSNIISDASFTSDERKLATVSWDKSIRVWDITTGTYRSQGAEAIEKAHEGSISSCDFTKDGSVLVTGGYDNQVCIWDIENMVQKLRLQGHQDWVERVCLSSDENWILSCSKDKTMRLWNIQNTDSIPMVMEMRKAIGLIMATCSSCGKLYSIVSDDGAVDSNQCVFCRLQTLDNKKPQSKRQ